MVRYYKRVSDDYIYAIGEGSGGVEIDSAEYGELMAIVRARPTASGVGYRLRTDLTWEKYSLPAVPVPEYDEEKTDMQAALDYLGVNKEDEA